MISNKTGCPKKPLEDKERKLCSSLCIAKNHSLYFVFSLFQMSSGWRGSQSNILKQPKPPKTSSMWSRIPGNTWSSCWSSASCCCTYHQQTSYHHLCCHPRSHCNWFKYIFNCLITFWQGFPLHKQTQIINTETKHCTEEVSICSTSGAPWPQCQDEGKRDDGKCFELCNYLIFRSKSKSQRSTKNTISVSIQEPSLDMNRWTKLELHPLKKVHHQDLLRRKHWYS